MLKKLFFQDQVQAFKHFPAFHDQVPVLILQVPHLYKEPDRAQQDDRKGVAVDIVPDLAFFLPFPNDLLHILLIVVHDLDDVFFQRFIPFEILFGEDDRDAVRTLDKDLYDPGKEQFQFSERGEVQLRQFPADRLGHGLEIPQDLDQDVGFAFEMTVDRRFGDTDLMGQVFDGQPLDPFGRKDPDRFVYDLLLSFRKH